MNYHNITYPDQNNGDGLRIVLWVAGCEHHCTNCQNQQTWSPQSGIPFDKNAMNEIQSVSECFRKLGGFKDKRTTLHLFFLYFFSI